MFVILRHAKSKRKIEDEAKINNVHVSSKGQNHNMRISTK